MKRQRCNDLLSMEEKRRKTSNDGNNNTESSSSSQTTTKDNSTPINLLRQLNKPKIGSFSVNSSLKDMVKKFLPQIASANEELASLPSDAIHSIVEVVDQEEDAKNQTTEQQSNENDDDCVTRTENDSDDNNDDDDADEDEKEEATFAPYIQMNLALGIFEERKKQRSLIMASDNDDEFNEKENIDDDHSENESDDEKHELILPGSLSSNSVMALRQKRNDTEKEKAVDNIMDALLSGTSLMQKHKNGSDDNTSDDDEEQQAELNRRRRMIEQLLSSTTSSDSEE